MPSIEFSVDKRDLYFVLYEQLKAEKLLELEAFKDFDRDTFDMVIEEGVRWATTVLAPINKEGDHIGAKYANGQVTMPESFKVAFKQYAEAGWVGLNRSQEWGGQGFPETLNSVFCELLTGANTSFALVLILNQGSGHLIEAFGSEELKKTYCEKIYSGDWGATMCLTEPQAGSDLAAVTTTAEPKDDHYIINGTKIFITNGDHDLTENIVHLVLAKIPGGGKGTRGISLFAVPTFLVNDDGSLAGLNDLNCARIEDKMGIKASPTCVMDFGENGQCKGWLVGEPHKGMTYMFQMMNEARLGVGLQGLGAASAAYMSALGYALERKQGAHFAAKGADAPRSELIFHPDIRRMIMSMKAQVEGMRSLMYTVGMYSDLAHHHSDPEKKQYYFGLLELLTPICKSYGSDMGFRVTETAIQVYGGYGYTKEYPVEQFCRDAKIASVYEGTNGIQALDLLMRKILRDGGARFKSFMGLVSKKLASVEDHALKELGLELQKAQKALIKTTTELGEMAMGGDLLNPLSSAAPYLEMFGHIASAFYLFEGAVIAQDKLDGLYSQQTFSDEKQKAKFLRTNSDAAFYDAKVKTARFFIYHILPKYLSLAAEIHAKDLSAMDVLFLDEEELTSPA